MQSGAQHSCFSTAISSPGCSHSSCGPLQSVRVSRASVHSAAVGGSVGRPWLSRCSSSDRTAAHLASTCVRRAVSMATANSELGVGESQEAHQRDEVKLLCFKSLGAPSLALLRGRTSGPGPRTPWPRSPPRRPRSAARWRPTAGGHGSAAAPLSRPTQPQPDARARGSRHATRYSGAARCGSGRSPTAPSRGPTRQRCAWPRMRRPTRLSSLRVRKRATTRLHVTHFPGATRSSERRGVREPECKLLCASACAHERTHLS